MSRSIRRNLGLLGALPLLLALWFPAPASGQRSIEAYAGIGYTAVDLDEWTQSAYVDWNQMMYQGSVQAFLVRVANASFGAEIGYDYFFWYTVPVPGYSYTRTREADATHLLAVARIQAPTGLFAEAGVGIFLFGDWTDVGIAASVGYKIRVSPKISVPIKLRAGLILDEDTNLLPVGVAAGLAYGF